MIGETIHSFTIRKKLGEGGMATVYLAENNIGRQAAIKALHKKYYHDENVRRRFVQEAKVMARLKHDNICKVMALEDNDRYCAIVMERLKGIDLKSYVDKRGAMPEKHVMKCLRQIAPALDYMHRKGIVHRNLKPSNLFLTKKGQLKILDFGIAKAKDSILSTLTDSKMGSVAYMSPEQIKSPKYVDYKTDLYSLGVTLHHLLGGKMPYDTTSQSQHDLEVKIIHELLPALPVSPQMARLLQKATEKDPAQHPGSVSELPGIYSRAAGDATLVEGREDDKTPAEGSDATLVDGGSPGEEDGTLVEEALAQTQEEKEQGSQNQEKQKQKEEKKPAYAWLYVVLFLLLGGGGFWWYAGYQAAYTFRAADVKMEGGTITAYTGTHKSIAIPERINGVAVTSIGGGAFADNQLTSVAIPNSVTSIGYSAFWKNQLTSVAIPNSVTSIGYFAFDDNQLTSVAIPNSVTSIGYKAFRNNKLTRVAIPNSVTSIGSWAFNGNAIAQVNGAPSNGLIYARNDDGSEDESTIVSYGGVAKVIDFIPNSVTRIGNSAFAWNQLTRVAIPNSVTSIGYFAFKGNDHLSSIVLPAPADPNKVWRDDKGNYYEPGSTITNFDRAYTLTDRP